jgi:hypothetical protein
MRKNMQYLSFWVWHILLNMMISISVHFPTNDMISFFFMAEYLSIVYTYNILHVHSSIDG